MAEPAPALADAIKGAEEALAPATYGPADWLRIAARLRSLLAALREPAPAPDYDWCPNCKQDDCVCCAPAPPAPAEDATACPDCSVQETAAGWTLRRCNRHRIDVRSISVEATRGGTVTYSGPVTSAPADQCGALAKCEVEK